MSQRLKWLQVLGHSKYADDGTSNPSLLSFRAHVLSCHGTLELSLLDCAPTHWFPNITDKPSLPERLSGRMVASCKPLGAGLCLLACYCIRPFMVIQQLVTDYEGGIPEVFC